MTEQPKNIEKILDTDGKLSPKEIQKLQEYAQNVDMKSYLTSIMEHSGIQKKLDHKDTADRESTALVQLYLRLKGQDVVIDGKRGPLTDAAIQRVTGKKLDVSTSPVKNPNVSRTRPTTNKEQLAERNLTEAQRVNIGIDFFLGKWYSPEITAGIIGNLKVESRGLDPLEKGDGGKARGIAQWHPEREKPLKRAGFATRTLMGGLNAIQYELEHTERKAYGKLMQCTTPEQAAEVFDKYYERSSGHARPERVRYAKGYYADVRAKAHSMDNLA